MKKLIVDCGATHADWYVSGGIQLRTEGFNLAHSSHDHLCAILDEAAPQLGEGIGEVFFYAAGLVGDSPLDLGRWFPGASIHYASDMVAAARAACGSRAGIAAILGTGANTCQWDGEKMVRKVNSGGFIVGDEGSAAVLGKLFVRDYIKNRVPEKMAADFAAKFPSDYPSLVRSIYASAAPARFLGSFAPFILSYYRKEEYAKELVDGNFCAFFERTVKQYDALPLGVVGGFGFSCKDILLALGARYGVHFSIFLPTPMEGLKQYHGL